jgi:hypothetical protein
VEFTHVRNLQQSQSGLFSNGSGINQDNAWKSRQLRFNIYSNLHTSPQPARGQLVDETGATIIDRILRANGHQSKSNLVTFGGNLRHRMRKNNAKKRENGERRYDA